MKRHVSDTSVCILSACAMIALSTAGCNQTDGVDLPEAPPSPGQITKAEQAAQPNPLKNSRPRFWHDEEVGKMIESIGHDHVYVFRWEGGTVKGWVRFDTEPKRKWEFDSEAVAENLLAQVGEQPPSRVSSGQLIVVMEQVSEGDFECRVVARVNVRDAGTLTVGSDPGQIKMMALNPFTTVSDSSAYVSTGFLGDKDLKDEKHFFEIQFTADQ